MANDQIKAKKSPMKMWVTEIYATPAGSQRAVDLVKWRGPLIPGATQEAAEKYCQDNGLGFCKVIGEAV